MPTRSSDVYHGLAVAMPSRLTQGHARSRRDIKEGRGC